MASTETMTVQDSLNAQYLSNSFSSLSRSRSTNSLIVRTYKQATQLYLTKQFKEALETLETVITPRQPQDHDDAEASGAVDQALVAQSSRGTRTKIWVFYLSLLNAIIELGQEQGKLIFGATTWRQLAAKARDGTVWDEVVRRGYGGNEGEVDADVVVNLATLLLGHMQDQKLNQQRLEAYLAASDNGGANGHLSFSQDGMSTPMSASSSSPKQLQSRLKILELYTLHVLPANGEWEYAHQFIDMNDMLDEERKEAFLNALQSLKEERDGTSKRDQELKEQREREMEEQRQEAARKEAAAARQAEEDRKAAEAAEKQKATATAKAAFNGTTPTAKPTHTPRPSTSSINGGAPARPSKSTKKPPARPSPPPTFYRRASSVLGNVQHMVLQASRSLVSQGSMAMLRLLMFVVAFLVIIARRDLRMKIRRAVEKGWVKVQQTVGMGVKVSYV